jgi:undecaprenyl-diphosphatase
MRRPPEGLVPTRRAPVRARLGRGVGRGRGTFAIRWHEPALTVGQAALLGALHGPAELLPISSSAHVALVPWLAGWRYGDLDGGTRKSFEVALHAGTAAALLIALRREVAEAVGQLDRRRLGIAALTALPAAAVGLPLEGRVERRLGTPRTIAAALAAGAAAMALADRAPRTRAHEDARAADGLWLGVAQASALVPGVSRSAATVVAARLRGFDRPDAARLSRHAALPVIAGAAGLKGLRLARTGLPRGTGRAFAAGTAAAFASTLASAGIVRTLARDGPLLPYAAYRAGLAAVVWRRLRRGGRPV